MRFLLCVVVALAGASPAANAQVFRCTGPSGDLTFSDRPCGGASTGGLVLRERSFEERQQELEQANEAEARKQNRRLAEQERDWAARGQRVGRPQAAAAVTPAGGDWASRKARENAATSASSITKDGGRWDRVAEEQREKERREDAKRRAAAAPPPTSFTNCGGGFCYDNQGGVYNRVSPDFMTGPNGKTCHRAGSMWNCN